MNGSSKRWSCSNESEGDGPSSKIPRMEPTRILPTPTLPTMECPSKYRLIELQNGLKIFIISSEPNPTHPKDPNWTTKFPSYQSKGSSLFAKNFLERRCLDPSEFLDKVKGYHQKTDKSGSCASKNHSHSDYKDSDWKHMSFVCSINVGSHKDPDDIQGLAHLVEHIVHYGSEEFPEEDGLSELLYDNYGWSNAFTTDDKTCYYCEMSTEHPERIEEALERYASLLTKPLINPDLVQREVEAVDNEHHMRSSSQFVQGLALIYGTTIDGNHPMKNFSCGSRESFYPKGIKPEGGGALRLKAAAHRFMETFYHASNMVIVLQMNEPVDKIQSLVEDIFNVIPTHSKYPADTLHHGKKMPFNMTKYNRMYALKPSKSDKHEVMVSWGIGEVCREYENKSLEYIGNLMEKDYPGGLVPYLRNRGWVTDLLTFVNPHCYYVTEFYCYIELTKSGRDNLEDVLEALFSFLKLHQLEGPQKSNFMKMKKIDEFKFHNFYLDTSLEGMIHLSMGMLNYNLKDSVIAETFIPAKFNKEGILEVLNQLVPSKANFLLFSWDLANCVKDQTENLYRTRYRIDEMEPSIRKKFKMVRPFDAFRLCIPKNKLLHHDLEPIVTDQRIITQLAYLKKNLGFMIYYPEPEISPQGVQLVVIGSLMPMKLLLKCKPLIYTWATMLNLQLCSKINDLEDLGTTASVVPLGFDLMFLSRGYRTGIANCILTMLDAFENIPNESTFMMAKDLVKSMYFRAISNSSRLTWGYLLKLKDPDYQTYAEELDTLNSCGFSDFCNFIIQFKNQMVFVTLSIGRITREEEQNLGDRLEQIRTHTRYMEEFYITKEKAVEQGTKCLRLKSVLDIDKVYAVLNFYEADASTSSNYYMIIIIFRGLLRPAFHQLRTVEQLGYLVKMNLYFDLTNDKVGFSILVGRHIEKHCPCYIDSRIDNFLDSFYTTGLEEIAKKYEHLLKIFEQTTDTLKAFYKEYFLSGGSSQAKLTIQVVTCRNDKECICQNAAKMTPLCKKFRWAAPIHWVGPQKAELVLAKDLYTDDTLSIIEQFSNPSYFIDNIDEYHGSKNNSSG